MNNILLFLNIICIFVCSTWRQTYYDLLYCWAQYHVRFILLFLYLHEFLVHQDHRKKVLRLRCNENYSGNMKTSNVTQFKQHLKMLSYSVVFIKKRWIYHRCLTKRYSENIQASTTHASCQISELFRTAIPKKRKTTGTAASLLFLLLSWVNWYINIIFS